MDETKEEVTRRKVGRPRKNPRKERKRRPPTVTDKDRARHRKRYFKARFDNPDYKARNAAQLAEARAKRAEEPERYSRLGVPDGWTREQADIQREFDRAKADLIMNRMIEEGMVEPIKPEDYEKVVVIVNGKETEVLVPITDEGKATLALREATIAAISPLTHADKRLGAIRTVLEWTKPKPAQTSNVNLNKSEDWLAAALKDNTGTNDGANPGASSAP